MLTRFGKIQYTFFGKDNFLPWNDSESGLGAYVEVKNVLGNTKYTIPKEYIGMNAEWQFISTDVTSGYTGVSSAGFAVGSGTTPASENDYTLESQILGLALSSISNTSRIYDEDLNAFIYYKDATLSNNTGSDVVISEIGLFRTYMSSSTKGATSSLTHERFLTSHMILDEPVTIPNGEAGVIRIKGVYPCS